MVKKAVGRTSMGIRYDSDPDWRWRIETRIMRLAHDVRRVIRQQEADMATLDEILDKVRKQKTLLDGLKTFIEGLQSQSDPAKLAAVVAELDANTVALDVLDGVVTETPPTP